MANTSIYAAFERISQHIITALATKSDTSHNHNDIYDTKGSAGAALESAKAYADDVKNDLLNGAGTAYDTLKELGDLIDDNQDAIDALETVAAGKADAEHTHIVADITDLTATATELNYMDGVTANVQVQLDEKADSSSLSNYYTKTETDNIELITVNDIDTICGAIQGAEDVMF